jgi:hypothetical protein
MRRLIILAAFLLTLSVGMSRFFPSASAQAPVPAEYQQLYSTLKGTLDSYNAYLATLSSQASYPVIFGAELLPANGNRGTQLLAPTTMQGVIVNLNALQELGVQGVTIAIGFPLYTSTFPNHDEYVQFYEQVAQEVRKRGMKLDIESAVAFANTQFSTITFNYAGITFDEFEAQVRQMVTAILQDLQPDYLNLGAEPDTMAKLTGFQEFRSPTQFAAYVNFILDGLPRGNTKIGAGVGTWGNLGYAQTLANSTALDFIDTHVYPIVGTASLQQIITINNIAKQHGKWLNLDEAWLSKVDTLQPTSIADNAENFRKDVYSFWAPLDQEFLGTIVKTAQLEGIQYISPFWSTYFFGYVDYDQNTSTMSYNDLTTLDNRIAAQNLQADTFTSTGRFYGLLATGTTLSTSSTTQEMQSSTGSTTTRPAIPAFPIEAILIGVVVGVVAIVLLRRRSAWTPKAKIKLDSLACVAVG